MKARIYWFVFLLYSIFGNAQNPESAYKKYTVTDGLPSSEVYHCLQDRNNHIWFATDRGVAKYNGYNFTVFNTKDGLTDNVVFELFEDYKGRIWILPMTGNLCYFENDTIVEYPYNELLTKDLSIGYGHSFYVDTLDNVYFGSKNNGMKIISKQGVERVLTGNNQTPRSIHYYTVDGRLLSYGAKSYKGLSVSDDKNFPIIKTSHFYEDHFLFNSTSSTSKRSKAFAVNQGLIFNSGLKLFLLDHNHQVLDTISYDNRIIYFDKIDELVIVGVFGKGLYIYKVIDQALVLQYHLLNQYTCSSFMQDKEGGYWITTTQQGVFYTPSLDIISYNRSNGLLHNYIYKLGQDDRELLISYPDTVQKLGQNFLPFTEAPLATESNVALHDSLLFNRRGCFIFYGDLRIFDICKNKRIFTSENQESTLGIPYQDAVYFLNISAIFRYNFDTITTLHLDHDFTRLEDLEIIGKDSMWIASTNGLYYYTPGRIQSFAAIDSIFSYRIVALDKTERFGLVVATRGGGLALVKGDSIKVIDKTNGLSTNDITSIYVDSLENIWVATNQGLHMVDAHNYQNVTYYSTNEGLISNEITDVRRIGEKVYVGTKKGLSIIDLTTFKRYPWSIGIEVLSIQLDGYQIPTKDSLITLSAGSHYLDLHYIGMSYRAAGNIQYRYRITGQESTPWIYTQEQRLKLATPSKPGAYQVEMAARVLPNGKWKTSSQLIALQVSSPFYQSFYFLFFSICLLLLLLYLGFKTNLLVYPKHVLHEIFMRVLKKLGRKSFITIKVDKNEIRIDESEILYVQSFKDYVEINTIHEKYLYRSTLKDMEKKLGLFNFIRVHRSYIVSINKIDSISKSQIKLGDIDIPIGKTYRTLMKPLKDQFSAINS